MKTAGCEGLEGKGREQLCRRNDTGQGSSVEVHVEGQVLYGSNGRILVKMIIEEVYRNWIKNDPSKIVTAASIQ